MHELAVRIEATLEGAELQISVYLTNTGEVRSLNGGSNLRGVLTHADGTEVEFIALRRRETPLDLTARVTPFEFFPLPTGAETFCGVWTTGLEDASGGRVAATLDAYFEGALNQPATELQAAPVNTVNA